jgi:hypothetical protein
LKARPGASLRPEEAVDLPLGQECAVPPARLGPVDKPGQPPQPARHTHSLLDGTLETLFAERHIEARFTKRIGERAERVPVEGLGRHRLATRTEVAVGRHAAELVAELA